MAGCGRFGGCGHAESVGRSAAVNSGRPWKHDEMVLEAAVNGREWKVLLPREAIVRIKP